MQWHSPMLEKTLCHALFLVYGVLGRSLCHSAHLLSIQFLFYAVLFIKRRQSSTLRKNALSYTHPCTVSWNATIQCNAMQCNAMAQPNARENAMSCSVPCIRCPWALAMPSSPIFWAYSSFFYAVLFIKRRQSPTLRKNAMSYTHPCTVSSNARNAIQPRRKERSSAEYAVNKQACN